MTAHPINLWREARLAADPHEAALPLNRHSQGQGHQSKGIIS